MDRKPRSKSVSHSKRAGVTFPVSRLRRYLHNGNYSARVSADAPVYMAGVLDSLCRYICLHVGAVSMMHFNSKMITSYHFSSAMETNH